MKTVLYYFTGTGNTLAIAEMLKKQLPDAEICPMIHNGVLSKIDYPVENAGIIFPVYMWSIPLVVERFIKENDFGKIPYIFSVANYGGSPGYAIPYINQLLKRQELKLDASFGIVMPGNYTPMYGAWAPEKQQKAFQKAEEKVTSIVQVVNNREKTPVFKTLGFLGWIILALYKIFLKKLLPGMDKKFSADSDCIGCGKCVAVCPVNNIKLEENRPVWLHKCVQCYACLQVCPVSALQAGKMTKNRKRYKYPDYDFRGHNS